MMSSVAHGQDASGAGTVRSAFTNQVGGRAFVLHRPVATMKEGVQPALVVVLHGCGQSADDIAKGTRMNEAADEAGFVVLYPEQSASFHPLKCWNWYVPGETTRGAGEISVLAGMIDSVATAVHARTVSLVGMSAGAAMAAQMAVAYPERYAALALHSGIAALAAESAAQGLSAMKDGPTNAEALGAKALAAMGARARGIPVVLIQGADDKVVSPRNLTALVSQWRTINDVAQGRGALVEEQLIAGVGHAWSGGAPGASYTAPDGPDATAMIVEFFRRVGALSPPPR